MGQYIIALAKLAGVKTLNVVRRQEAAEQVRQWGGDRVVLQGDNLQKDIEDALDGKKLSLVLDTVGGSSVGELAKSLETGGSIVVYAMQSGQLPIISPKELIYRGLSLHGFWLINWIRNAPRIFCFQDLPHICANWPLYKGVAQNRNENGIRLHTCALALRDTGRDDSIDGCKRALYSFSMRGHEYLCST